MINARPGAPSLRQLITSFISVSFVGFKNREGFMLSDKNCLCETLLSGILDVHKIVVETICNSFRISNHFVIVHEFIMYL